ncbi:MAG: CoA-binding protein [Herminiimonas sp.]|nr:CoA-binding protein [Herminiimonas sp.]
MTDSIKTIPGLLAESRTIAMVGLSAKPDRPSHEVARYMQAHGFRIIPVNPTYAGTHILDEHCYATLTKAAEALQEEGVRIDIVDCFRKSDAIGPLADEAIAIRALCLWMQIGVINPAAAEKAQSAGLIVVMDRCIKIEHMNMR